MSTTRRLPRSEQPSLLAPADTELPTGQLSLGLETTGTPAVRLIARQLPAQLRLDARTRQVGRAGIAELRRILADAGRVAA